MLQLKGGSLTAYNGLTNHGSVTVADPATFIGFTNAADGTVTQAADLIYSVTIANQGLWDIAGDHTLTAGPGGNFESSGTVRKSAGSGTAAFSGAWRGTGQTIDVRNGTLEVTGLVDWADETALSVAAGATLRFPAGAGCCSGLVFSGALTGSGGGTVEIDHTALWAGRPGTTDFPAGMLRVDGGIVGGSPGNTTLTNEGAITLSGEATLSSFTNRATGTVTQQADTVFGDDVVNQGHWELAGDHSLAPADDGGQFENDGTLRKTTGSGTARIEGEFDGYAQALTVDAGTLELATTSFWDGGGRLTVAGGATIVLRPTLMAVEGLYEGAGAGRVVFAAGKLYGYGNSNAALAFAPGQFHLTGGLMADVENMGDIAVDEGRPQLGDGFSNGANGTIRQSGTGAIDYFGYVINGGLLTIANDQDLTAVDPETYNSILLNFGTLRRDGGTGNASLSGKLSNSGTVDVRTGKLTLGRSSELAGTKLTSGTWLVSGTGTLSLPSAITESGATLGISGPNARFPALQTLRTNTKSLTLSDGAALVLDGDLANSGALSLERASRLTLHGAFAQAATGTLAMTVDGRPGIGAYGALQVAGVAALDGTLAISTGAGFTAVDGDRFPLLRYVSSTGSFAHQTGLGLPGGLAFAPQQGAGALNLRVGAAGSARAALEGSAVAATGTFVPGDDLHVDYTVTNAGDATTAGSWSDAVYLSADDVVDAADTVIGHAAHSGSLAHGASYAGSLTAKLPGFLPGSYRVLVVPDSGGANPSNPVGAAASAPLTLDLPVLTPGTPLSGTVAAGADRYYRLAPGSPGELQLDVAGAEQFARIGALPTPGTYDATGARLVLADPGARTVYVLVRGAGAFTLSAGPVTPVVQQPDQLPAVTPIPTPTDRPPRSPASRPTVTVRGAASATAKSRGKRTFTLQLRNAGTATDGFKVRGTGNRPGFTVQYLSGSKDVTKAVEKGAYRTARLKPGATTTLRLVVTVRSKGKRTGTWTLTATSSTSAAARSAATVKVRTN